MSDIKELLRELDREHLDEKGYTWECASAPSGLYIIIKEFSFPPEHYNPSIADLLILLPAGYPNASPDMFWTIPDVKLMNGNWPATANVHETHCGREWQRWSRHNTVSWRAGVDELKNFIASIRKDLSLGK